MAVREHPLPVPLKDTVRRIFLGFKAFLGLKLFGKAYSSQSFSGDFPGFGVGGQRCQFCL